MGDYGVEGLTLYLPLGHFDCLESQCDPFIIEFLHMCRVIPSFDCSFRSHSDTFIETMELPPAAIQYFLLEDLQRGRTQCNY